MAHLGDALGRTAAGVLTRLMAPAPTWDTGARVIRTPMTGSQKTWLVNTLDGCRGRPAYHNNPNAEDLAWAHYALDKMGWDPETVARTIGTDRAEHPGAGEEGTARRTDHLRQGAQSADKGWR